MEFALIVWAIGTLPGIAGGILFFSILISALLIFGQVVSWAEEADLKLLRYLFITIPLAVLSAAVPDKETAYAMAAAYGVQSVAENERVQKLAGSGLDVLESYLEKTKKELEKEAK